MTFYSFMLIAYTVYLYRFTLFLYYCKLCYFFDIYGDNNDNNTKITHFQNVKCISFNYNTFCTTELSCNAYKNNTIKDALIIMKTHENYMIYPNLTFDIAPAPFIICEIVLDNKHFDITKHLKLFYVKNNVILTRPFITYIFHTFFDIHIYVYDNYSIKYIDNNANVKIIDNDINIYNYTI